MTIPWLSVLFNSSAQSLSALEGHFPARICDTNLHAMFQRRLKQNIFKICTILVVLHDICEVVIRTTGSPLINTI